MRREAGIPRLYAAASLKRFFEFLGSWSRARCIPRLYAAASLKRVRETLSLDERGRKYSAALCRGLIEGSLTDAPLNPATTAVFRGSMPRPH